MAGETEEKSSGWTVDTLHAHISSLLQEMDRRYTERFEGQEKAIDRADLASEKRFDAVSDRFTTVNEFRGTLTDQATTFITRTEVETQFKAVNEKTAAMDKAIERAAGRSKGLADGWGYLVAAIAAATGIVSAVVLIAVN
jgi:hypothetical protein